MCYYTRIAALAAVNVMLTSLNRPFLTSLMQTVAFPKRGHVCRLESSGHFQLKFVLCEQKQPICGRLETFSATTNAETSTS